MKVSDCTHPDHVEDDLCLDRSVGCSSKCPCCMENPVLIDGEPMRVFVDLDGVLADFDAGYFALTGTRSSIESDDVDWSLVAAHGSFYQSLPLMDGAAALVVGVRAMGLEPTVLTGCPRSIPEAAAQKRVWVESNFPGLRVITCKSREKCLHGRPGDVLIDDWPKYQKLWEQMGGIWITHESVESSLEQLGVANACR